MTAPRRRLIGPIELLAILFLLLVLAVAAWRLGDRPVLGQLGACAVPLDGRPLVVLVSLQAGRIALECIRITPADRQAQTLRPA